MKKNAKSVLVLGFVIASLALFFACKSGDDDSDESPALSVLQEESPEADSAQDAIISESATGQAPAADSSTDAASGTDDASADGESSEDASADDSALDTEAETEAEGGASAPIMSAGRAITDETERNGIAVGDVILQDGTSLASSAVAAYIADGAHNANPPVAVVAYFVEGGYACVGMPSEPDFAWATEDAYYATKKIASIMCYTADTGSGNATGECTFTGDVDGSDNWAIICSLDAECALYAEDYYPAFAAVSQYEATCSFADWYVPSIAELYKVYANRGLLAETFVQLGYEDFEDGAYWSSSPRDTTRHNTAFYLNFKTATIASKNKTALYAVLPIFVLAESE